MREVSIGGKEVRLRATPVALLFYRQEFGSDLVGDLVKMEALRSDYTQFDSVALLQLTWAMAKADKPKGFPSFEKWVAELEHFDMSDEEMLVAIMEEAADGFFRRGMRTEAKGK